MSVAEPIARRSLFWIVTVLAAVCGLAEPAAAQGARTLDQIVQAKRIRFGVNPTLPLLASLNASGQLEGFEIDMGNAIAKMMGNDIQVEFVQLGSPDRIPFVQSGRVDMVMGSLTRTPARALVIDFTVPVTTQATKVITVQGRGIGVLADLNKPTTQLIQVRGTIAVPWIQENAPLAQLTLLDNYPDAFRALSQGRGNAMVDVAFGLRSQMKNFPQTQWVILPDVIETAYTGIGVAKGNHTVKDWLNLALFELHRTGFVEKAWTKWYGEPMTVPVPLQAFF